MALPQCNVPGQSVVYEYLLTTEGGGGGGGGMVSLCHFSVSQQPANKVTKNETIFFIIILKHSFVHITEIVITTKITYEK